jgi:hypothetical protein
MGCLKNSQVAMCLWHVQQNSIQSREYLIRLRLHVLCWCCCFTGAPLAVAACHSHHSAHAAWWHAWRTSATQTYWMQVRRRFTAKMYNCMYICLLHSFVIHIQQSRCQIFPRTYT